MKTVNYLFFLFVLVGACFSDDIASTVIETNDDAPVITSERALKDLMQTTTDLLQMCDELGICYDVKFLNPLDNTKDNHGTEISTSTVKEVESFCYTTDDCSNLNMVCVDNRCQCYQGLIRWNNTCYRPRGSPCAESSDCMSTRLQCIYNQCVLVDEFKEGNWSCHNKSGAFVCWGNDKPKGSPNILCRSKPIDYTISGVLVNNLDGLPQCEYIYGIITRSNQFKFLRPNEKIVWKSSNINLSNAIYGGQDNALWEHLYLICQTEHDHIKYLGQVFQPNYNACRFVVNGTLHESKIYDVLVYDA